MIHHNGNLSLNGQKSPEKGLPPPFTDFSWQYCGGCLAIVIEGICFLTTSAASRENYSPHTVFFIYFISPPENLWLFQVCRKDLPCPFATPVSGFRYLQNGPY